MSSKNKSKEPAEAGEKKRGSGSSIKKPPTMIKMHPESREARRVWRKVNRKDKKVQNKMRTMLVAKPKGTFEID